MNNDSQNNLHINISTKSRNKMEIEYNHLVRSLAFTLNSVKLFTMTDVYPMEFCRLVPCLVFCEDGEEITVETSEPVIY